MKLNGKTIRIESHSSETLDQDTVIYLEDSGKIVFLNDSATVIYKEISKRYKDDTDTQTEDIVEHLLSVYTNMRKDELCVDVIATIELFLEASLIKEV